MPNTSPRCPGSDPGYDTRTSDLVRVQSAVRAGFRIADTQFVSARRAASAAVFPAADGSQTLAAVPPLVESYRRLAEVFHHVLSEQSLDNLLDRIADTLAELVPYDALHLYEADNAARDLVPKLARTEWADEVMRTRPGFGEGITGWAVANRQPVLTNR